MGYVSQSDMDLLSQAYATAGDDDDDYNDTGKGNHDMRGSRNLNLNLNLNLNPYAQKRARIEPSFANPSRNSNFIRPCLPAEVPMPGSYISKRQRAAAASHPEFPEPITAFLGLTSIVWSLSESNVPPGILTTLNRHKRSNSVSSQAPQPLSAALSGHSKAVNAVRWSKTHPHLLASAGMDSIICIWNVWSNGKKQARILSCHNAAVKDIQWSQQGLSVLSCGYDCTSRLIDVEKGMESQIFREGQIVEVVKFCPDNYNIFLSGGSKGQLKLWDIRTGTVVHQYVQSLGPILDVEFTVDGKNLITSSDVSKSNISENSIIVWDVSRQVPLSNQIYTEAYTCPCLRIHPLEPYFIAQSNGNYIAIISTRIPFKLDKYKRYEGHGVDGFPIKCNFSLDGKILVSGSSEGYIYFYDSKTSKFMKKVKAYEQACVDVAFHPTMPDVVASCSWSGAISVSHQNTSKKWETRSIK